MGVFVGSIRLREQPAHRPHGRKVLAHYKSNQEDPGEIAKLGEGQKAVKPQPFVKQRHRNSVTLSNLEFPASRIQNWVGGMSSCLQLPLTFLA